ncbi:DNA polymerase III subunit epsilon (endogenous virus) [Clostridium phage phiCTC2A]|uniref:DNA polymerase III alpha subunit n=1 Tax=Clostridium tetani (strain Massachusetts / E88) TaxID=212717 RepID=Q895Z5_CLOTE|nr:3'-5' exonuclease [Clostridium tetani]YP_009219443.1 DNA polymerase [Clostridium phage phiCT9441A]YP_009277274.1 DNA polymerase [Clostridium phage phiCTC2A]YP_009277341.1 DNA polymerase [Clostridium phage phiCT19406A]AAO35695.1 DNA polymerase III alpha subunit [Clostridium tetani E88]AJA42690.1 DNA polymerase III subunit epsilon [Clostridium phage phiCT9441A]AJA42757.1 DNA polymerase III subunit epsilon [Clostridium phage phiCT19406A]AJA42953.1 DNA polymerase III subunit epsilon [Clostrid
MFIYAFKISTIKKNIKDQSSNNEVVNEKTEDNLLKQTDYLSNIHELEDDKGREETSDLSSDEYYKKLCGRDKHINYSKSVFDEFVVIDLETTGLYPVTDKIIEITAIKYKSGQIVEKYNTLINPKINIPKRATEINNITNNMVKDSPVIEDVLPELLKFIKEYPLVAHNASFDIKFLNANLALINREIKNVAIDTLQLSRAMYTFLPNHKLTTIKEHLCISEDNSHRALPDCITTAEIYLDYCYKANNNLKEFNELEKACFKVIKDMLNKNNRDTEFLKLKHTGNYTDIAYFYPLVRIKVGDRKQYFLTNIPLEELKEHETEKPSKSENFKSRIHLKSEEDLKPFEEYIIQIFDEKKKSFEWYKNNIKSSEIEIVKYLAN